MLCLCQRLNLCRQFIKFSSVFFYRFFFFFFFFFTSAAFATSLYRQLLFSVCLLSCLWLLSFVRLTLIFIALTLWFWPWHCIGYINKLNSAQPLNLSPTQSLNLSKSQSLWSSQHLNPSTSQPLSFSTFNRWFQHVNYFIDRIVSQERLHQCKLKYLRHDKQRQRILIKVLIEFGKSLDFKYRSLIFLLRSVTYWIE